jgi:hypothetical protein
MLTIRPEQLAALSQYMLRGFRARAERHLRSLIQERGIDFPLSRLPELVDEGIKSASAYGLLTQRDQVLFMQCMLVLGTAFDRDPNHAWASEILLSQQMEPDVKAKRLWARAEVK